MRTPVDLDRDVEGMLRETALRTRQPFKKVLNDTLRSALERRARMEMADPFVVEARPMGLRAGLDPAGFNRLAEDLEVDAFIETTRKLAERSR